MRRARMLVLLACALAMQAPAQDAAVKKQLAQAGAALGKALATHDMAALETVWSPKMIVNGPNNTVLTRDQVFEAMRKGQLDYEPGYTAKTEKIEFFGNVAVTMGEDTYTPNFGPDKGKLVHRRSTNVWQYENGSWMLIARQATIYDPAVLHY